MIDPPLEEDPEIDVYHGDCPDDDEECEASVGVIMITPAVPQPSASDPHLPLINVRIQPDVQVPPVTGTASVKQPPSSAETPRSTLDLPPSPTRSATSTMETGEPPTPVRSGTAPSSRVPDCAATQSPHAGTTATDLTQRSLIFYVYLKIGERSCKLIVDSGSCINAVSEDAVAKLGLTLVPPPTPYNV